MPYNEQTHAKPLPDDFIRDDIHNPIEIVGHFAPFNYTPTKEETKCLIKCAVKSVIRWYELNKKD